MNVAGFDSARLAKHQSRKRINRVALALSLAAMAFGVFWLVWILVETVRLGFGGLALSVFTASTPAPQVEGGGLANAIVGSLIMVSLATAIGTPIGVLAGIGDPAAGPTLVTLLADPVAEVRRAAAVGIAELAYWPAAAKVEVDAGSLR